MKFLKGNKTVWGYVEVLMRNVKMRKKENGGFIISGDFVTG